MKVLLVSTERLSAMENSLCAPLGILSLASIAKKLGHETRIVNLRAYRSRREARRVLEQAVEFDPDLVGFSAVSLYATVFEIVARFFRRRTPRALLVGGGPHATSDNVEILNKGLVDICVSGEGELTFGDLLKILDQGKDYRSLSGISYIEEARVVENEPAPLIEDLDSLPLPAWELLDFDHYHRFSGMADFFRWSATLFTSRGCPYRCIYCHNMFGKKFRARSAENVLAEIEMLRHEYGVKSFEFVDDIFNFDRARTVAILEGIRDRYDDVEIAFPNGVRTDLLDEELIRLLKEARCWHVSVAIETASPAMQKFIRKNLKLEKVKENLQHMRRQNLHTRGFLMIGFPGESEAQILDSMKFALEQPLNYSLIFIVSPYRKTELHRMLEPKQKSRIRDARDSSDYRLGTHAAGDLPYRKLEKIRSKYYRKGILRWRNRRYWISAIRGLLADGALVRIAILIGQFIGLKSESINRAGIKFRTTEYEKFRRALDEDL